MEGVGRPWEEGCGWLEVRSRKDLERQGQVNHVLQSLGTSCVGWGLSRMYSHVKLASKLSSGCDYALFKVGSAPGTDSRAFPSWMTRVWAATDA